ncbi:uncharacterized protein LOC114358618 [Ostrinia furnacalis]|uniref:uncharacterized protein LOC114358618 n=1 Tax=Ostrinia furnacalis TaxID=93504 RepID=UPI00103A625A|nr:uncharacterized protein LOC114358618 [Ostrinia furnacalis]
MSATQVYSEEISGDGDITQAVSSVAAVPARPVDRKFAAVGFSQRMRKAVLSHLRLGEFQKEPVPKPEKEPGNCSIPSNPRCKYGVECLLRRCVYSHVAQDEATPDRTPQMRRPKLLRRHIERAAIPEPAPTINVRHRDAIADATPASPQPTRHPRRDRRRKDRALYVIPNRARS